MAANAKTKDDKILPRTAPSTLKIKFNNFGNDKEKLFDDMAKAKIVTEAKRKVFNEAYQKVESLEKLKEQVKTDD